MAKKGMSRQAGKGKKRTVLQLQPVKYQIELYYLGHARIKHEDGAYRCRYQLTTPGSLDAVNPCTLMPNVVRNPRKASEMDKAARSRDDDGSSTGDIEKGRDKRYRIVITDNHGTRKAEALKLAGAGGDHKSSPQYYKEMGWLQDVMPAVPFRVIVRRLVGDTPVDIESDKLKVVVEVKDPSEELDQNDGRRKTFLEGFFKKHNREKKDPTPGDDNAQTEYKGLRNASNGKAGAKATDVLKKVPYKTKPIVTAVYTDTDVVLFKDLGAATAEGDMNAKFDLESVKDEETGVKVGVADLSFNPWPAGGDNYRFLISLKDEDEDKDIRKTKENGADVTLLDDDCKEIPEPRWYTAPRLTIWRKIEFKLMVRANETVAGDITWDNITKMYRKDFVEVVKPEIDAELTLAQWKLLLQQVFSAAAVAAYWTEFTAAKYRTRLFPDLLTAGLNNGQKMTKLKLFARKAITLACKQRGIKDPRADPQKEKQADGAGMFLFLCHNPFDTNVVGSYMGDRIFWLQKPTVADAVATATKTCAHEFGHVRSLRHAHTKWAIVEFAPADGPNYRILLVHPTSNNFPGDHDAKDAYACLMSYLCPLDAEPCGLCALGMRFYDRVEIQKNNRYRSEIMEAMGPVDIVIGLKGEKGPIFKVVTGTTLNLSAATNQQIDLFAVGPETEFTFRTGQKAKGRVNLTYLKLGEKWDFPPDPVVDRMGADLEGNFARWDLCAVGAGSGDVVFRLKGQTAKVTLKVT